MGSGLYYLLELFWRGYSHWTMGIVGGLSFVLIGSINEHLSWKTPLWKQAGIGTLIILTLEFITGCIVNIWLGWQIWDYSDMPFNLLGQISLPFAGLWFILSALAIILDDVLRSFLFHERFEGYRIY
nr:putative ABC transporter permease [Clostridium aminobutyricum]